MKNTTEINPLKRINQDSIKRIVVPNGMTEAGYKVVLLPKENRFVITWVDPKKKAPPQ